jgi:hypothetical protein
MLIKTRRWRAIAALVLVYLAVSGCAAVNTFPMAARAGDTVILAVGSPDGMTAGNTTATFTSDGGSPVPIAIRSVFKLYPDKTSAAWLDSNARNVENATGHGPWSTMIAVDLPPGLPVGHGVVNVTTSAVYPPSPARDINTANIGLEILPAAGTPDPLEYEVAANLPVPGDLSLLEPMRRIVVKPVFTGLGSATYGAIEVKVNIPLLAGFSLPDLRIIADEKIQTDSNYYTWTYRSNGDLVVYFVSPTGRLDYSHVYFSIISPTIMSVIDEGLFDVNSLSPVVTFYDIDGHVAPGQGTFEVVDES